jgi:hypothetical protein
MNLADVLARKVSTAAGRPAMRIGIITFIADGLVTVRIQGVAHPSVRYLASYAPELGDEVVVNTIHGQWLVQGKMSRGQVAGELQETVADPSGWAGFISYGQADPWNEESPEQGIFNSTYNGHMRGLWFYEGRLVPVGAVIMSAKITIACIDIADGETLVNPMLTAHVYDAPAHTASEPTWVYGPKQMGSCAQNQTAVYDIPSGWWAEIESGVIHGFGLSDDTIRNRMKTEAGAPNGQIAFTFMALAPATTTRKKFTATTDERPKHANQ